MPRRASSAPAAPRAAPMTRALSPDDEQRVRRGIAESERGECVTLTEEETRSYAATGVLPDRVQRWFDSHG